MSDITMIRAAAERLRGQARVTPMLNAPHLDAVAGRRVFLKAECLQRTGSFKFRGGWSAVSALPPGVKGVIAYSSGNHAQGVAHAATLHGLPCVVLMPADAPQIKIANTRAYGADVITYDRATEDRDAIGAGLAATRGLHLIKPYDDPFVIAGQGTIGLEIAEQAAAAEVSTAPALTCCGGGGMTSGIALALEACAPGMSVRPVEPEGFDDTARSLLSGRRERNARTSGSICDAIITPSPGEITFPILQRLCGPGLVVTEEQALRAMALAFTHFRVVLEPGGAVALAAAIFAPDLPDTVIAVGSGGNVDPVLFADTLKRFA
jgi:threonine dehydratase